MKLHEYITRYFSPLRTGANDSVGYTKEDADALFKPTLFFDDEPTAKQDTNHEKRPSSPAPIEAKRMFVGMSSTYDAQTAASNWVAPETLFKQFKQFASLPPKGRILDVGAGTGHLTEIFRKNAPNAHITAIDLTPEMLAILETRNLADDIFQRDVQTDGLPFADNSFDIVGSNGMFEFIDDPQRVIDELARVVKPGGYVTLSTQAQCAGVSTKPQLKLYEFKRMLEDAGLKVLDGKTDTAYQWSTYNYFCTQKAFPAPPPIRLSQ